MEDVNCRECGVRLEGNPTLCSVCGADLETTPRHEQYQPMPQRPPDPAGGCAIGCAGAVAFLLLGGVLAVLIAAIIAAALSH
jgi:hypothetical protein